MSRHHIRKREGKSGVSWYATVDLGRDPATGKRVQKHVSGATRKTCEAEIARVLALHSNGESVASSKVTVSVYLAEWLENIKHAVKPTTIRNYRDYVARTINPYIGEVLITKLTALHVQRMLTALLDKGQSPTSVNHTYGVLLTALNRAVSWGIVPRNVCDAVDPPKRATPEIVTWSIEQAQAALEAAKGTDLEALWRLAITTGMRRGELLGLRWQDVDFERGSLSIRHTLVRGERNIWESSTPKTKKSQRRIELSTEDVAALKHHLDRQRIRRYWTAEGLVFLGPKGGALHANSLRDEFDRLTAKANLPRIRIHDLRHTAASLMLAAGEHPKVVQERLGHSTIAMTLDRYSHVTEGMQREAAERLETVLKRSS